MRQSLRVLIKESLGLNTKDSIKRFFRKIRDYDNSEGESSEYKDR